MCITCGYPERPKSARALLKAKALVPKEVNKEVVEGHKICPICSERSEQPHQIHYGGLACFSCKAFFRRAHQKTRHPEFECKKSGDCMVDTKSRRKCQKCRYERCLANGMNPDAVLNDDQKKIRFRHSLKKKEARESLNITSREFIESDSSSSDDEDEDNDKKIKTTKTKVKKESKVVDLATVKEEKPDAEEEEEKHIIVKFNRKTDEASGSDSGMESANSPPDLFAVSVIFENNTGSDSDSDSDVEPSSKKLKVEQHSDDADSAASPSSSSGMSEFEVASSGSAIGQQQFMITSISRKFAYNEEHWLQGQFALLKTCYESVSLGEDHMKEVAMYSLGVPLSKHFMPHMITVAVERFTRAMDQHPEVAALSEPKRSWLHAKNIMVCVALNVAKLETCKSGCEQLTYMAGMWDDIIWKKNFQSFFSHSKKLKKITMAESNKTTQSLAEADVHDFARLTHNIAPLVRDPEMYKLLMLAVMFAEVDDFAMPDVGRLRDQYLDIWHRRQLLATPTPIPITGDDLESRFHSVLNEVREVASIIQRV